MGYELDQLKRIYDVASPTLFYGGSTAPEAPVKPLAPNETATPGSGFIGAFKNISKRAASDAEYQTLLAKYNTDLAAYNTALPGLQQTYAADQNAYNAYKDAYNQRLKERSIYQQNQFGSDMQPVVAPSTTRTDTPDGYIMGGFSGSTIKTPSYGGSAYQAPNTTNYTYFQNPEYGGGLLRSFFSRFFKKGGQVKTHFQSGGLNDLASQYDLNPGEALMPNAAPAPVQAEPATPAPAAPASPAVQLPVSGLAGSNPELMSLLSRYFPAGNEYNTELKAARQTMTKESEAFNKLLQDAINQKQESGPSKAEMYFRLAAAFGAPTKTGNFMESLGKAGESAATMNKEQREAASAERARRLSLGLEAQKLRMSGAKEDLTTLRQLAAEGMKDKRTIATELIKDYVKSGQPESSAGKQAKDEGLVPGTAEYQARVAKIAENNVSQQLDRINATLANVSVAQANQALQQQKFDFQQTQATKLTAPEVKLKTETEDSLSSVKGALQDMKRAFDLNKNSMGGSLVDKASRLALEAAGSKDPTLLNTQELENILKGSMISSAAEKMKGVLSDSDIKLLAEVSGAKAKNQEERRRILINAYGALQRGMAKQQKRLNEINQGLYRETAPAGGLE